ncbi:MAG: TetR/AcrR family transcriptional regulator [Mailhella sp.]|nr:TetR/AcrR family transcriptional regulator [Mailhella sp.]MBQ3171203.1 TetR/AcrR family transcriptional regulator [Mailhella sp.]MBQ4325375.1 TetR/AcrR family transcriptional regulator [Mailhella sp.]MBQ4615910.1 TetR/AcrR family transcriptional regulator [Mailhella sp.]
MKSLTKKEALLQAAKELFGEYGFAETTFKKISDRAGVALGLLTHHYGNKEKLFFAAGMDVLESFIGVLQQATSEAEDGRSGVLNFCRAYLAFSIDPSTHWLVLVRCSPYSDMKTSEDRDIMLRKFEEVHHLLEIQLQRGVDDGSIVPLVPTSTAQVITGLMVGANRTRVLTPYTCGSSEDFYTETLSFVDRAISSARS